MSEISLDSTKTKTNESQQAPTGPRVLFRGDEIAPDDERATEIAEELGIAPVTARILVGRGVDTVEDARRFLWPSLRENLPNPRGIKNMPEAVAFLADVVERDLQITIYHDFDVDGLSGGAQLYLYLVSVGARVNHYAPNRFTEGYGLVTSAIEDLARAGTEVLVTVDCGITNIKEIARAKELGMSVLVLDHHHAHELPPADVVVDPAQEGCPFQEYQLCAAGLVWMLLIVLRATLQERWSERIEAGEVQLPDPKNYIDLATLGTICDMVPLVGPNRVIAYRGVQALQETQRPGLIALKEVSGVGGSKKIRSGHVSFGMGPRINAAGRLADAGQVFELLTTGNSLKAQSLAQSINKLNQKRREIEEDVRRQCLGIVESDASMADDAALAIFGEEFHAGVIGIVAQRLVEQFYKPATVMAPGEMKQGEEMIPVVKGSVRSVRGFHVADALQELSPLLLKHGGHAQAGGFTLAVEKLEEFRRGFIDVADSMLSDELRRREILVDGEVAFRSIDYDVVEELGRLAPFGIGNPSPLLVTHRVIVETVQNLTNGHLRLRLNDGSATLPAVAWRFRGNPLLVRGNTISVAYQPELNSYQGMSMVQLNVRDVWTP